MSNNILLVQSENTLEATPLVIITAGEGLRRASLDAGCDFFANKPIRKNQLLDIVSQFINLTRKTAA